MAMQGLLNIRSFDQSVYVIIIRVVYVHISFDTRNNRSYVALIIVRV